MVLEELISIAESAQNLSKVHELMHDAQKNAFLGYTGQTIARPQANHGSTTHLSCAILSEFQVSISFRLPLSHQECSSLRSVFRP